MIRTERLDLVPGTPQSIQACLDGRSAMAAVLDARVPASWPPEFLDDDALRFTLDRLASGPDQAGWWLHFVVLRGSEGRVIIGSAGYKGPPAEGAVEVGYGIVPDHQRRGYATEVVRGLLGHAFSVPVVERVIGETYPTLIASIGVLRKCGFRNVDGGSEPGVIRFAISRAEHATTT
ncbi:MAG TPA: GNAT family N-acetyltransferase [Candidatus Eisenbacteria bacterium]|nr:GNAT family N-acetyltransferase [Candidatus Eisenbacteria bacterium]